MDRKSTVRQLGVLAAAVAVAYLGYQAWQRLMYAHRLANETLEDAVQTVAITHAQMRKRALLTTLRGAA